MTEATMTKEKIIALKELVKATWSQFQVNWQKFGIILIFPLVLSFLINLALYLIDVYTVNLS